MTRLPSIVYTQLARHLRSLEGTLSAAEIETLRSAADGRYFDEPDQDACMDAAYRVLWRLDGDGRLEPRELRRLRNDLFSIRPYYREAGELPPAGDPAPARRPTAP
jgi:hypothetical protein